MSKIKKMKRANHNIFIIIGIVMLLIISTGSLFLLSNKSFADKKMDDLCECFKICYTYTRTSEIDECMNKNCFNIIQDLGEYYEDDEYKLISDLGKENKEKFKCMNGCEEVKDDEQTIKCFETCLY